MATNTNGGSRTKTFSRQLFDTKIQRLYDRPLDYTPEKYLTADKQLPTIGFDPQMAIDIYGNGVLLGGLQTIAFSILRLLFTVPGQFPDYPDLGIDIRRYLFSFEDEFTAAALRGEILRQLPLLNVYVADTDKFQVVKTKYMQNPVVVIQMTSSMRSTNGLENEQIMNIGITFDEFHKLVSDISFAMNGEEKHYNIREYMMGD